MNENRHICRALGRFECYDEKADVTWTFVDVNPDLIEIIDNVHEEQMRM